MGSPIQLEGCSAGPPAGGWHARIWPRRPAGPLAAVMVDLIDWLVEQGYASTTQRNHVRAAARLGSWMVAKGLTLGNLDASRVVRMVSEDNARHRSIARLTRTCRRWSGSWVRRVISDPSRRHVLRTVRRRRSWRGGCVSSRGCKA